LQPSKPVYIFILGSRQDRVPISFFIGYKDNVTAPISISSAS
jgi:hypothetical protein